MNCQRCGSEKTSETPHEMHGAKLSCAECGRFIKWKGKKADSLEYYEQGLAIAEEKGLKPGWAWHRFKKKFGRPPTWEEKGEDCPPDQVDLDVVADIGGWKK
jgi:hypothetical protein